MKTRLERPSLTMLVSLAVLLSTWTELTTFGLQLSDWLFALAVGVLVMSCVSGSTFRSSSVSIDARRNLIVLWLLSLTTCLLVRRSAEPWGEISIAVGMAGALLLTTVLVRSTIRTVRTAKRVLMILVVSGGINGLVATLDLRFGMALGPAQSTWHDFPAIAESRAVGLTGHPNVLGFVSAAILPIAPVLIALERRAARMIIALSAFFLASGLVLSGSRGGALGALAGLLYLAMRAGTNRLSRRSRRLVWASILAPIALVVVMPDSSLGERVLGGDGSAASNSSRIVGLKIALEEIRSVFPSGLGLTEVSRVHSGLLALLVGGGLLLLIAVVLWAYGVQKQTRLGIATTNSDLRHLTAACMASGVGTLVFLATSPVIYHRYALVPVGVALALSDLAKDSASPPSDQRSPVEITVAPGSA